MLQVAMCGSPRGGTSSVASRLRLAAGAAPAPPLAGQDAGRAGHLLATGWRRLIVTDLPAEAWRTRAVLDSAAAADVFVMVVDAGGFALAQVARQSCLLARMGVGDVVLAVNKMDLVGFDQGVFDGVVSEYMAFAQRLGLRRVTPIPVSAVGGDNLLEPSARMPWYPGPTLVGHLEAAEAGQGPSARALPPGNLPCANGSPVEVADQFEATLVWLDAEPMLPGRPYVVQLGEAAVDASVTEAKYRVNTDTLEHVAAKTLERDQIGVCNLALARPLPFEPYTVNRALGGFFVLDKLSGLLVGYGMLHFALRRAHNIHLQHVDVDKAARSALNGQKPCVLWFTGLSGSGKSTIANQLEKKLHALGRHTYLLDGDNVRHGLCKDLGFTDADRVENIRRVGEIARLMADAGLIVMTAFISPFRAERRMARSLLGEGEFIEIHVDTPLEVAEQRDVKGLYRKARRGELKNFTGIDSPYEAPEAPELRVNTSDLSAEAAADIIIGRLRELGRLAM